MVGSESAIESDVRGWGCSIVSNMTKLELNARENDRQGWKFPSGSECLWERMIRPRIQHR